MSASLSSTSRILIHVGYHKTGTTWLQTGFFRDEKIGFLKPWESGIIRQQIVSPSEFEFDASRARTVLLEQSQKKDRDYVLVMSDERLSGSPHSGGYDSALIANRLAASFPEARILIVIREQNSAIYSIYHQYVRDGGAASLKNYLTPRNTAEVPQFHFVHLEYHHLISLYYKLFGRSNVLVLPFEWLSKSPDDFLSRITSFAGLDSSSHGIEGLRYPSLGAATIELKRWANFLFVRNSLNPSGRFYVKDHERRFERLDRFIPHGIFKKLELNHMQFVSTIVGDRYRLSNEKTADLIEIDLSKLGYPVRN